ncbi:hypothetical protein DFP93_10126 [Aneurinibacillus soli]|uniref:Uncharacterized protein n=1 Tax=Aneurinibacillus soli TaxID=1500254 RepID=A0A0U5B3L4_9BACL|nr:hypothetical protein [Aneurinibacillus soli]PYE64002.1 hypothetical protein DFP93_10126 [Aneurinibacillus soli]BAU27951.1 hypothetical protein CB4_02125 [Aneurinibacillus soli]
MQPIHTTIVSGTRVIFNSPPEETFRQYFDYLANSGIPERVKTAEEKERAEQEGAKSITG